MCAPPTQAAVHCPVIMPQFWDDITDPNKFLVGPHGPNCVHWFKVNPPPGTDKQFFFHLHWKVEEDGGDLLHVPVWILTENLGDHIGESPDPGGTPPTPDLFWITADNWGKIAAGTLNPVTNTIDAPDSSGAIISYSLKTRYNPNPSYPSGPRWIGEVDVVV